MCAAGSGWRRSRPLVTHAAVTAQTTESIHSKKLNGIPPWPRLHSHNGAMSHVEHLTPRHPGRRYRRRRAMTGAAAGIALATARTAAAAPDPIFGLIGRHRAAYEAHGEACKATDAAAPDTVEFALADAVQDAACAADCNAMRTLVRTTPTTFAGAAALLRYLIEFEENGNIALSIRLSSDDPEDHSCVADALLGTLLSFMEARA